MPLRQRVFGKAALHVSPNAVRELNR